MKLLANAMKNSAEPLYAQIPAAKPRLSMKATLLTKDTELQPLPPAEISSN